jgi:hypothetical protein
VEQSAFFEIEQIRRRIQEQSLEFTPHFLVAFKRLMREE